MRQMAKERAKNFNFLSFEVQQPKNGIEAEDYLGCGFDLVRYDSYNVAGCRKPILDIKGKGTATIAIKQEQRNGLDYKFENQYLKAFRELPIEQLDLANFGKKSLNLNYRQDLYFNEIYQANDVNLKCRAYTLGDRHYLDVEKIEQYKPCLSDKFLEDLRKLSGAELVKRYGTHLITSFEQGALSQLSLKSTSDHWGYERVFDENDLMMLAEAVYNPPMNEELREKVEQNRTALRIKYYQTGSDYLPKLGVSPTSIFSKSDKPVVDKELWFKAINKQLLNFLRVNHEENGLIFIPNLIDDLSLKIKYLSAIVFFSNSNRYIHYYLCDPKTFKAIEFEESPIILGMSAYKDKPHCRLYSETSNKILSEEVIVNKENYGTYHKAMLQEDGLWTFLDIDTKRFLCRDLKYRTAQDDSEGLRFWALNPVIPKEGYVGNFSQRLVQ